MYHVVSAPPPGTSNPGLWTDPELFARQVAGLQQAGYEAVTLHDVVAAWDHGAPLPRRPIVLSFDDGYASHSTHARPVLERVGWPGVLNLELANLGTDGITTRQVRKLLADGWELGSHTLTHPDMTTLDDAALRRELVESRKAIERRFGLRPEFFCYPAGRYDARVIAAVRAAGYRGATTTEPGIARAGSPRFALPRIRVDGGESPEALLAALTNA
jgi:peptidoglycan/xylan/chitin deacetylase (PgdA/CDA1 family)